MNIIGLICNAAIGLNDLCTSLCALSRSLSPPYSPSAVHPLLPRLEEISNLNALFHVIICRFRVEALPNVMTSLAFRGN